MKRHIFSFICIVVAASAVFPQFSRSNRIYRPCPSSTTPASVSISRAGAISLTPCSGQGITASSGFTLSALTQGSVLFMGASGLVTQDNVGLFYNDATNSVVVGGNIVTGGSMTVNSSLVLSYFNQVSAISTAGAVSGHNATTATWYNPKGLDVASAAAIAPTGNIFHVTGTTTITSITSTGVTAGTTITIIFDGILTFTDGSNLKLAGSFVTTADDTITLVYDGTNWYETARAVN